VNLTRALPLFVRLVNFLCKTVALTEGKLIFLCKAVALVGCELIFLCKAVALVGCEFNKGFALVKDDN